MASFDLAIEKTLKSEGKYSNDPDDSGGETYYGISRNNWSKWSGWTDIDIAKTTFGFPENIDVDEQVKQFYQVNFWDKINGDDIASQEVAESIFDFAVNAGVATSAALAQMIVGAKSDGVIGIDSISKINTCSQELFLAKFTIAKIARYVNIAKKRPANKQYFYGWVIRALEL
jgi:lysozyme family protein